MDQTMDPKFDGTVIVPLVNVEFENNQRFKHSSKMLLKICREKFLTIPSVIFTPKHFHLTDELNEKIRWMQENGLIQLWHSKMIAKNLQDVTQKDTTPKVLTFDHLSGVFQIWSTGCLFALMAFVCESLMKRLKDIITVIRCYCRKGK